jgi:hypothetical protein
MEVLSFGGGGRQRECASILERAPIEGRLILLPIPTTRDNKFVSGTDVRLGEIENMIDADTAVAGYRLPPGYNFGNRVYDGEADEDLQCKNADLTARGALGYLLSKYDRDICDLTVGVVGYGRIGSRLLRLLLLLGARAVLYTKRRSVAEELSLIGVETRLMSGSESYLDLDVLINTAPERLVSLDKLQPTAAVVDLASGNAFDPDERLVKLGSLPEKLYPVSAGRIYAEAIMKFLKGGVQR